MKTKFSTRMLALALILTLLVPMLVFNVSAEEESATITFDDKAKRTTFTSSQQVWEENGITVTNDKSASTSNVGDYAKPARFYKSSKLTVAFDKPITKIVFDCNSSSYATALKNAISGSTVSSDKVTVILDGTATSFTVASLTGGQVRVDSVTVYYAAAQGSEPTPSINISGDGALQIGDTVTLTATPANITGNVAWSSSDETVATVDGGVVTGKKMGKATITASIGEVQATHEVTVYPKENSEITVGEALDIATLAGESGTPYTYMIMGTVKSIDTAYSTDYKNITVTISDDTGSISVFRMKGGEDLLVGQTIIVCGGLNTYNGKPQVAAGSTYELTINESLKQLDVKMSLAYSYETAMESDATVYKNSSFALRVGADKALADIEGVTSYGLMVSAGDKDVYFSTDAKSWNAEGEYCYVTIDLGDIINDLDKLSTKFTVKAYVEVDGAKYTSENEATYSVADMVNAYYGQGIAEVAPLYEYLVANGKI